MRYYLDTNVLIFLLLKDGNLDKNVEALIDDTSNILYVSSIATNEVLHLYKTGKINIQAVRSASDLIRLIKDANIEIRSFSEHHLRVYADLKIAPNHNDPNDHTIISQTLAEKISLISSDHKFELYREQGLNFVFNKR